MGRPLLRWFGSHSDNPNSTRNICSHLRRMEGKASESYYRQPPIPDREKSLQEANIVVAEEYIKSSVSNHRQRANTYTLSPLADFNLGHNLLVSQRG